MLQLITTNSTRNSMRGMLNTFTDGLVGSTLPATLPMDIIETPDAYLVSASVPGFTRNQLSVELDKGVLTISAVLEGPQVDPTECSCEEDGQPPDSCCVIRKERSTSSATRTVKLPANVNEDEISASLLNGVLSLVVPKPDDQTPRKLPIH
jgi:HSP20 family protein